MRWYYGWNVVAVGMLFQAIVFGIGIYCFTFWVSYWTEDFAVGRGTVMLVFLGIQIGLGVFSPFAGKAIDRYSIRGLICLGALCLASALVLSTVTQAIWQLVVLFGVLGAFGILLAGPLANQTLTARWFDRRRGLALGISTTGTSVGGFVIPVLMTSLQAAYGWRGANLIMAAIVIAGIVPLAWMIVKNSPDAAGIEGEGAGSNPAPIPTVSLSVSEILKKRAFWGIVLSFTPIGLAFGGAQQNLAPFTQDFAISAQDTSYLVSIMSLAMVGAKLFFGGMADRWDHRVLLWIMCGALAIAFILLLREISYVRLMVICVFLGISAGGFLPLMAAVVSQRFGIASFGLVMGMVGPFASLSAVGPWLAGYLRDQTGSYELAWEIFGLLVVPAAVAALLLRQVQPRKVEIEDMKEA